MFVDAAPVKAALHGRLLVLDNCEKARVCTSVHVRINVHVCTSVHMSVCMCVCTGVLVCSCVIVCTREGDGVACLHTARPCL